MSASLIAVAIAAAFVVLAVSIYNQLVTLRNRLRNAFSQIDVQLKRRHDLIPNLVETAKAYLKHERETLEKVVQARNMAYAAREKASSNPSDTKAIQELVGAESALSSSLGRLMAVAEAYPELKASQNMAQLSEELASTENKVSFARQAYNDAVMEYNTARERFPNVLMSAPFGFKEAVLFEVEAHEERSAPRVSFS
jgi:LemA protein